MRVWRLLRAAYASVAYEGVGAARGGGRWNSRGVYIAYAAASQSLAMLEYLVHIPRDQAPDDLLFIAADIPDGAIETLDPAILPAAWQRNPPPMELRGIGDTWVRAGKHLALRVPSVIIPTEWNLLINPQHPRFTDIVVATPEPARLDPRLIK